MEVDLLGQVGAETAGGRVVGGVGGQVDYLRAAHHADTTAVVALPARAPPGASRIVPFVEGTPVTSLKSDVDVGVTNWGVADIRACWVSERIERLIAVVNPAHRASLAAQRSLWI